MKKRSLNYVALASLCLMTLSVVSCSSEAPADPITQNLFEENNPDLNVDTKNSLDGKSTSDDVKNNTEDPAVNPDVANLRDYLKAKDWKVAKFIRTDETSITEDTFKDYVLHFGDDNKLSVLDLNGNLKATAFWSVNPRRNAIRLLMTFANGTSDDISNLNYFYNVESASEDRVEYSIVGFRQNRTLILESL